MGALNIVPLGGSGEIGKNCTLLETDKGIIVLDCGISFPHEEHHGVDIVIPDFSYLLENKERVLGIVLTHAHEDHVGALSFLLPELHVPVFASRFTEAMVTSKLKERLPNYEPKFSRINPGEKFNVGGVEAEAIRVTHSIPETCAIAFHTEHGIVLFTADFKFDPAPVDRKTSDIDRLAELGEEGVLLLLCDSTNIERPGWGASESEVGPSLKDIFHKAEGRVLVTQFSSNIHRMQQIVEAAAATGRFVSVAGRRMDMTFQMCRSMEYLHVGKQEYVPIEDINRYPDNKLVIIVTGSQGEPTAALSQMARREYSRLKILEGDTVVYSARPIPGNEAGIWRTVNALIRMGAEVITEYPTPIHVSGHAYADEAKEMLRLTKPFYVAPVHGEPKHQRRFEKLLIEGGHKSHRIFVMENGDRLVISDERAVIQESAVTAGPVYIDQHGNAEVTKETLRERTFLANDGVLVATVVVDRQDASLRGRPVIQAHGFVGTPEDVDDITEDLASELARLDPAELCHSEFLRASVKEHVGKSCWRRTKQKPVVIASVSLV